MKYNYGGVGPEHELLDISFHDVYYAAPKAIDVNSLYMQVNRAGIAMQTPQDFLVSRDDSYRYGLIHCVLRGKGNVSFRGHTFPVCARQAFVLPPNEGHMYTADPQDPMAVVWVEYGGGNSSQITSHILDLGGPLFEGKTFVSLVNLLTSILYQPKPEGTATSLRLYEILMTLCEQVETDNAGRSINYSILEYIDNNIDHRLSLAEVSGEFGYHPTYFSSYFPKMAGTSFSKYVMSRKISHACYLLETTNWSIERISHRLGFCNMSHFIRRFKEIKQVTPLVYRNGSILYQKRHTDMKRQGGV